jgi:hypothetical protein
LASMFGAGGPATRAYFAVHQDIFPGRWHCRPYRPPVAAGGDAPVRPIIARDGMRLPRRSRRHKAATHTPGSGTWLRFFWPAAEEARRSCHRGACRSRRHQRAGGGRPRLSPPARKPARVDVVLGHRRPGRPFPIDRAQRPRQHDRPRGATRVGPPVAAADNALAAAKRPLLCVQFRLQEGRPFPNPQP